MSRGVVFSIDALLAIAIVIVLLSGAALLGISQASGGPSRGMLYAKSSDEANLWFLCGNCTIPQSHVQSQGSRSCSTVWKYDGSSNPVEEGVSKCVP
ncbi:MAG: hypothetical protein HY544_03325 [Candidatus Diapherotrites archaeon]|uniref:Uncharacterized protein n=1 Tax=Candidatus Iainarchaeum sp. TaxID=3101447 RepID=A0A8T3YQU0_9ARCH|nr:hypothetical protein [Candidatus Diapherotrites archaeon]